MSITRVDISSEIQDWRDAVYGEEVRSANISALTKLQTQMNAACDGIESLESDATDTLAQAQSASTTANAASASAQTAITTANNAITQAQGYANAAAASATQAAGKVTDAAAYARDANTYKTDALAAKTAAETARDEAREAVPEDYEELTKCVSNPNLLDNGFYTINQRGFSSGSAGGYCADRWRYSDTCTANVITNGLHLKRTANGTFIYECIEMSRFDTTKQVTLTFNTSVGELKLTTAISADTFNVLGTATNGVCARLYRGSGHDYLRCMLEATSTSGAEVDVYSAKLEYGTLSTLANDRAPDYATELLKCQRYFYSINMEGSSDFRAVTDMTAYATNALYGIVSFPTEMRTKPTASFSNASTFKCVGRTNVSPSSITSQFPSKKSIELWAVGTGYTVGDSYWLRISGNGYINLSADL